MGLLNKVQARFKLSDTAALAYAHGVGVSVSSRYILRGVRMKVALAVLALAGTGRGFLQAPGSRLGLVSRRAVEDAPSTAVGFADLATGSELYIANLAYDTSHAELRAVMEFFGDITEVKIPRDKTTGQGRGFGFVSFSTSTEAETARMVTNGLSFKDRKIGVSFSNKSSGKQATPSLDETLDVRARRSMSWWQHTR